MIGVCEGQLIGGSTLNIKLDLRFLTDTAVVAINTSIGVTTE